MGDVVAVVTDTDESTRTIEIGPTSYEGPVGDPTDLAVLLVAHGVTHVQWKGEGLAHGTYRLERFLGWLAGDL